MSNLLQRVSWCAAALLASPCAFADVLTVGGLNPAYPDISAAVAAAVDGDLILVRTGGYPGFTIDGKAVSVVADTGASVSLYSPVAVRNLPANASVVVRGITLQGIQAYTLLKLQNNAGHVRVESVVAIGSNTSLTHGQPAVDVVQCADAAFVHCSLTGPPAYYAGFNYAYGCAPGLAASSSTVTLYECSATGGRGLGGYMATGIPQSGSEGAAGCSFADSTLFARGSSLTGGPGGNGINGGGPPPSCTTTTYSHPTSGGPGGTGLEMFGALSSAQLVATLVAGGSGGIGGVTPCGSQASNGATGAQFQAAPGVIATKLGPALSFSVPPPAREGQNVNLHIAGPPGSLALLVLGASGGAHTSLPLLQGVLLAQPPLRRIALGTIPPAGFLDTTMPVPADLGPGVEAIQLHAQTVFIVSGRTLLASPGVIVMLDAAF